MGNANVLCIDFTRMFSRKLLFEVFGNQKDFASLVKTWAVVPYGHDLVIISFPF